MTAREYAEYLALASIKHDEALAAELKSRAQGGVRSKVQALKSARKSRSR
jgi:hypothetical protein